MDSKIDEIGLGKYARRGNEKQAKTPKKISWGSIDATLLKIEMKVWRTGGLFVVSGTTKGLKGIQRVEKIPDQSIRHIVPWVLRSIFIIITEFIHRLLSSHVIHPTATPSAASTSSYNCVGIAYVDTAVAIFVAVVANRFFVGTGDFLFESFFDQLSIDQTTSITQRSWT